MKYALRVMLAWLLLVVAGGALTTIAVLLFPFFTSGDPVLIGGFLVSVAVAALLARWW